VLTQEKLDPKDRHLSYMTSMKFEQGRKGPMMLSVRTVGPSNHKTLTQLFRLDSCVDVRLSVIGGRKSRAPKFWSRS
jgi:hypothetical protein